MQENPERRSHTQKSSEAHSLAAMMIGTQIQQILVALAALSSPAVGIGVDQVRATQ